MTTHTIREIAEAWLAEDDDHETKEELRALLDQNDDSVLADPFGPRLEFGTAGLRGVLGPGPNRMNRVMIRKTTAGLAAYLIETIPGAKERGVVIGRDARKNSSVFTETAAEILMGAGVKVYVFPDMMPTPLVSYATRELGAAGGIMITASHNPPEYNGYKVYWETSGQIVPPHDRGISAAIEDVGRSDELPRVEIEEGKKSGLFVEIGEDLIERYLAGVDALAVHPEASRGSDLVISYTPLHGVGAKLTDVALRRAGFEKLHMVPEQREPDPNFSTVNFPNPEEEGAMDLVMELGRSVGADIAIAADPDADRLAVALPVGDTGKWKMLGGDDVGVLIAHYLLTEGGGGSERAVASTIVSSRMLGAMARHHGITYLDTLTGLKWIVDAALRHKSAHGSRLVMGYENALGYTVGELVRDKDGISAASIFAEMAAWLKKNGRTVWDLLEEAHRTYGLFITRTTSLVFPPTEMHRIQEIMAHSRGTPLETLGGLKVEEIADLEKNAGDLPPSNLLLYWLENDARVLVRPSGTEPKLKSYYEVREVVAAGEPIEAARNRALASLDAVEAEHQAFLAKA